jgi:hypothetical protein
MVNNLNDGMIRAGAGLPGWKGLLLEEIGMVLVYPGCGGFDSSPALSDRLGASG